MGIIASFEEMADKRKRGCEVIDGMIYDPDYAPTEEDLSDPVEQAMIMNN